MLQELEAVKAISAIIPIRVMISYLYLRNQKKWSISENVEKTYLDSGAYSQINNKGDYPFTLEEYIKFTKEHRFDHVSTLDYPCDERFIADLTIKERIEKTVENTAKLTDHIENLVPVIQGKMISDYVDCIDLYNERGLMSDYVGIGSICIRKGPSKIIPLVMEIKKALPPRTKIHCYGLEVPSIRKLYPYLESSDSHSWAMGQQLGGRIIFFKDGKLGSFPRNNLPAITGLILSLHAYNQFINHITRERPTLPSYHSSR